MKTNSLSTKFVIIISLFVVLLSQVMGAAFADSKGKRKMFTEFKQQVFYVVYGNFDENELNPLKNIEPGILPSWVKVKIITTTEAMSEYTSLLRGPDVEAMIGDTSQSKELLAKTIKAKNAVVVYGETIHTKQAFKDYMDISSFVLMLSCLDNPISVFDLRTYTLAKPETWAKIRLKEDKFDIQNEILVTIIPEEQNKLFWLHTKGMIKFGQPELSMHGLTESEYKKAFESLNTLASQVVLDNKPIKHESMIKTKEFPNGLYAYHDGSYEDDDFWGNVHVELIDCSNAQKLQDYLHKSIDVKLSS